MANGVAHSQITAMHRFFWSVSVLCVAIAILGFWPTYFGPLVRGIVEKPPVIHFHAVVFSGWLALFVSQIVFASTGRIALHKKVGKLGIGYGIAIIIVGVFTAFAMFASRVEAGQIAEAQQRLLAPLTDMIAFPIFFGAAVYYRRKPETHKRLMLVATTVLLVAAAFRMNFLGEPLPRTIRLLVWFSPVLLAMGYDFVSRRLIHPAYVLGLIGLLTLSQRGRLLETDAWHSISGWLVTLMS